MLAGLEKRLRIGGVLIDIIDRIRDKTIEGSQALELFSQLKNDIKKEITPEILPQYEEAQTIQEKLAEIAPKKKESLESFLQQFNYEKNLSRLLQSTPEVDFILTLESAIRYFERDIRKLKEYKENPDLILDDLEKALLLRGLKVRMKMKIDQFAFTPLAAHIILNEPNLKILKGGREIENDLSDIEGRQIKGTFISVIRQQTDAEKLQVVTKHEEEHVVTRAFGIKIGQGAPPIDFFESAADDTESTEKRAAAEENLLSLLKNGEELTATRMLDDSHAEILSELYESDTLQNFLVYTQKGVVVPPYESNVHYLSIKELNIIQELGSSIGHIGVLNASIKKCERSSNKELALACKQVRFFYLTLLQRSFGNLAYGYALAEKLGSGAEKHMRLFTYLLRPSQWHHIPTFIKSKYENKLI